MEGALTSVAATMARFRSAIATQEISDSLRTDNISLIVPPRRTQRSAAEEVVLAPASCNAGPFIQDNIVFPNNFNYTRPGLVC